MWCHSAHTMHIDVLKRVDACCHWLPANHTNHCLAHSIWHYPIWDKAQCFMLETLHQISHLLHETLCLKASTKRLRSRKPLRAFVELLSTTGEPTTPTPPALHSVSVVWIALNLLRQAQASYGYSGHLTNRKATSSNRAHMPCSLYYH